MIHLPSLPEAANLHDLDAVLVCAHVNMLNRRVCGAGIRANADDRREADRRIAGEAQASARRLAHGDS